MQCHAEEQQWQEQPSCWTLQSQSYYPTATWGFPWLRCWESGFLPPICIQIASPFVTASLSYSRRWTWAEYRKPGRITCSPRPAAAADRGSGWGDWFARATGHIDSEEHQLGGLKLVRPAQFGFADTRHALSKMWAFARLPFPQHLQPAEAWGVGHQEGHWSWTRDRKLTVVQESANYRGFVICTRRGGSEWFLSEFQAQFPGGLCVLELSFCALQRWGAFGKTWVWLGFNRPQK